MISVRIENAEKVALRIEGFPLRLLPDLKKEVSRLASGLVREIVQNKLSGQVLKVKTGRLRRSIHQEVEETADGIAATVGTNVPYAAVHEYGFTGDVDVPEYSRRNAYNANKKSGGYGGRITLKQALSARHSATALVETSAVKAHVLKMKMPERSYLRSALKEQGPAILAALEKEVARLIAEDRGAM